MCLSHIFKKRRAKSLDPEKFQTTAIPPMPMRQNSRGEYTRDNPWRSGGVKGAEILSRAVSVPLIGSKWEYVG